MSRRSLDEWLDHLLTLHPKDIELGLERVSEVAARMDLLEPACPVVTVAGTNGKGSTTGLIEAIAVNAGKRVGVFTSPHLLRYNERIKINGEPVSDGEIIAAFEAIERHSSDVPLTFFEYGTLAALAVFAERPLDLLVLEVGLGGRLDAVNIIDANFVVITSISLDHMEWLGDNRESIGAEKAGVMRAGVPVVVADADPPGSVVNRAASLDCPVYRYSTSFQCPIDSGLRDENVYAALTVADLVGMHPGDAAQAVLGSAVIPGRLQQVDLAGRRIILDVAHNPAAISHLAGWVREQGHKPAVALFAALSDKDVHAMIPPCHELFDRWYVAGLPGVARSRAADKLADEIRDIGEPEVSAYEDVESAWRAIQRDTAEHTVIVFGSFFTVAEFMKLLGEGQFTS